MSFAARETSQYSGEPYQLYQFSTVDNVWRFTGADEQKTYLGAVFTPEAIFNTEPQQGGEIKAGNVTVTLPGANPVAALFIPYSPNSTMFLTIFRAHDGEADSETVVWFTGKVIKADFGDATELVCEPEQTMLMRSIPNISYQPQCNRVLYSVDCTVQKAAFKTIGVLSSVVGAVIKSPSFATKPNGYFNAGYIEFGNARRMILNHVGDTLTLIAGLPNLAATAQVSAFPGCNHLYNGDCIQKFANGPNFFGFEWIPTSNPFVASIT